MGREQERVQAEENTVIHHSTTTIDTGHTHLQKGGENDKLGGGGGLQSFTIANNWAEK